MLSVFGDESSDETGSRVFAVAGVVGSDEQWARLETLWTDRNGKIPFHAKDCESDRGDYTGTKHAENQLLYRDLTTLLAQSGLAGWGFAIDLAAQRKVFPEAPNLSYYKGFVEVLSAMMIFAANSSQSIRFTFDMRKESNYNSSLLYSMYSELPGVKVDMFPDVTFACSRDEPNIQVADLWAREVMKSLDNVLGPKKRAPRKSWVALIETDRFAAEAVGEDWFLSLKSKMPSLQEETGINAVTYQQWLNRNRLVNNTTNMFGFLDSHYRDVKEGGRER